MDVASINYKVYAYISRSFLWQSGYSAWPSGLCFNKANISVARHNFRLRDPTEGEHTLLGSLFLLFTSTVQRVHGRNLEQ